MSEGFSPPWDYPAWIILDRPSFLANIQSLKSSEAVLDFRLPFFFRISKPFVQDFKRLGIGGFITNSGDIFNKQKKQFFDGWQGYFAPSFPTAHLDLAARKGMIPVLSHTGEAVMLSNIAQSLGKSLPLLLRVRSGNLLIDAGQTGILSLFEMLSSLPMLELKGFFLDEPFLSKADCDNFMRAAARFECTSHADMVIVNEDKNAPMRLRKFCTIGEKALGFYQLAGNVTATLTLQAWGVPIANQGNSIILSIDIGTRMGLFLDADQPAFVEGVSAILVGVEENRLLVKIKERPNQPSPWRVTLLGFDKGNFVSPNDWGGNKIESFLTAIGSNFPLFIQENDSVKLLYS